MKKRFLSVFSFILSFALLPCTVSAASDLSSMPDDLSAAVKDNYWAELQNYNGEYPVDNAYPIDLLTPEESTLSGIPFSANDGSYLPQTGIRTDGDSLFPYIFGLDMTDGYKAMFDPSSAPTDGTVGGYNSLNQDLMNEFGLTDIENDYIKNIDDFTIYGDLKIDGNTGNDKAVDLTKGSRVDLNFSVDLSIFRNVLNTYVISQSSTVQNGDDAQKSWDDPINSVWRNGKADSDAEVLYVLELPVGLSVDENTTYTIDGLNGFTVTATPEGQRLSVHVRKDKVAAPETYKAIYDRINNIATVTLKVNGILVGDNAPEDKVSTVTGYAYGMYDLAGSTNETVIANRDISQATDADITYRNVFYFAAKQNNDGRDSQADAAKPNLITLSFNAVQPTVYDVTYAFVSGTDGQQLPEDVTKLLPAAKTGQKDGTTVATEPKTFDPVKIDDGTWTFTGWDQESVTVNGAAVTVTGTWTYTADPVIEGTVIVNYVDEEGNAIAEVETLTGKIGESYTTEEKAIEGYTFKELGENSAPVSGNYSEGTLTVTYVYTKNEEPGGNGSGGETATPDPTDNPTPEPKPIDKPTKDTKMPDKTCTTKVNKVAPKTGESGMVYIYGIALLGSAALLIGLRKKLKENK